MLGEVCLGVCEVVCNVACGIQCMTIFTVSVQCVHVHSIYMYACIHKWPCTLF